jgi:hypothetical protein
MLMVKAVKGVVHQGRIELSEAVDAPDGTEVVVSVPLEQDQKEERAAPDGNSSGRQEKMSAGEAATEIKSVWEREWERSWNKLEKR